jgi:tetratricopeptide (TPR) repeat protein
MNGPDSTPMNTQRSFFLSGKVRIDDGTALTDPPAIQSVCRGHTRTETYTDRKGTFSFEISPVKEAELGNTGQAIGQASDSAPFSPRQTSNNNNFSNTWRECELQAVLPGFTSEVVEVAPHLLDFGTADVGTIVLHRQGQVQGFTISATTAAAPDKARKEYDKGRELEKKQEWGKAIEKFKKALEVYPKYAVAWFEMGRAQQKTNDTAAAHDSFHQALTVDPKYVSPYQELARMAFHDGNWREVVDTSATMLKLNPVSFPQEWLLNASANYYLKNVDAAEQSALKGLQVDTQHHVPQLEHLLGVILAQKNDYRGALEHIRKYLALAPNAEDAQLAAKQVEELEKKSAQTQPN